MTAEMIALARRAVACKGWRWMAGMKIANGIRVTESLVPFTFPVDVPDISDPATLGCLLALVREAWGDPGFYVMPGNTRTKDTEVIGWDFFGILNGTSCKRMLYRSEAEALVAALEAAP